MKLKKIASLALAGIMAVSMLAGCNGAPSSSEPTNPVEPVDTSFATAVNNEMSTATKNVLTFSSDSKLASVLNTVADKIDTTELLRAVAQGGDFVLNSDAQDFRHLLGLGRNNGLTAITVKGVNMVASPLTYAPAYANTESNVGNGWDYWHFFSNYATSASTVGDLIVVPGGLTEEGVAEVVADAAASLIAHDRMPNDGTYDKKQYKYDYTGNIACVKVNNLSGDGSAYIVGVTITQTPVQVTNVQ